MHFFVYKCIIMQFSQGFIFPRYEFSQIDTQIYDFQQKNLMEKKFLENRIFFPISDGLQVMTHTKRTF